MNIYLYEAILNLGYLNPYLYEKKQCAAEYLGFASRRIFFLSE
jgi:hypothetical protein